MSISNTSLAPPQNVKISQLKIDRLYHRGVDERFVREMLRNFDPNSFGLPLVAIRDGVYYIVDGLQRTEAVKCRGEKQLPCRVFVSSGPADEAQAYLMRHNNLPLDDADRENAQNCCPGK